MWANYTKIKEANTHKKHRHDIRLQRHSTYDFGTDNPVLQTIIDLIRFESAPGDVTPRKLLYEGLFLTREAIDAIVDDQQNASLLKQKHNITIGTKEA